MSDWINEMIASAAVLIWIPVLLRQMYYKPKKWSFYLAGFLIFLSLFISRLYSDTNTGSLVMQLLAPIIVMVLVTKKLSDAIIGLSVFYFLGIFIEYFVIILSQGIAYFIIPGQSVFENAAFIMPFEVSVYVVGLILTTKIIPLERLVYRYYMRYKSMILLASINVYTTLLSFKLVGITSLKNKYVLVTMFIIYLIINLYIGAQYMLVEKKKKIFTDNNAVTHAIADKLIEIQSTHKQYKEQLDLDKSWIDRYVNLEDKFLACYMISKHVSMLQKGQEINAECNIDFVMKKGESEKSMHVIDNYLDSSRISYDITLEQDNDNIVITLNKDSVTLWERLFCKLNSMRWCLGENSVSFILRRSYD